MQELLDYLYSLPSGPIEDSTQLEVLLSKCWHEFEGSFESGMRGYKIYQENG